MLMLMRALAALQEMQPLRAYTLVPMSRAFPTQTRSVGGVDLVFGQAQMEYIFCSRVFLCHFSFLQFLRPTINHPPQTYAAVATVLVQASLVCTLRTAAVLIPVACRTC
ncbi:hypothetical protein B0H16DRAFT_1734145 [Mycena metata]|uniref:Uncharacterized protein n=1 Tax=Mycena metata TaxID=1033252 RepID=A0AAD7HXX8_9AGAR|nr:hypothetical protein B0H16DRAFT_1734145 [Mycena metata]